MTKNSSYNPYQGTASEIFPFLSSEEAWFWFIQTQKAKNDGAQFRAGQALFQRPCEPIDILKTVDRLYRNRRLMMDHLLVLRHYGQRLLPPDASRVKEMRAAKLWKEAHERLGAALENKGIIQAQSIMEAAE